jgi:hypothetical protein
MFNLPLKFVAVFAGIGFLISFGVGYTVQQRFDYVVLITALCTLLSGALGWGVYKILQIRVPEILEILEGSEISAMEPSYEAVEEQEFGEPHPAYGGEATEEFHEPEGVAVEGAKAFGDHIILNKVKIKNEPKLIAKAIQTMLAKDSG